MMKTNICLLKAMFFYPIYYQPIQLFLESKEILNYCAQKLIDYSCKKKSLYIIE